MAYGLGLDVMMEVHTLKELETVMDLEAEFICINNADPHTLQANPAVTEKLIEEIPASVTVLSAGGIRTVEDAGANGVLLQDELARMDIPQDFMEAILALRAD